MDGTAGRGAGASIRLAGVARHYGMHRAVDDVHLDVRAGEFITLLGPSGSGKTTVLMLVAGFERPSGGRIVIDGADVARLPPWKRGIGVVFQSYALFPHMTVAENIGFPLKQRGRGRAERDAAVHRMLDLVQLPGMANRYPQQLSGGQQQRVAIARAAVFDPRVMLMDEPLSALDKHLRETLQLEIKRLHDRLGITFVYVTHDQVEAMVMSDRVCVMRAGQVEQVAAPRTLYDQPANRFVASFLGEANLTAATGIAPGAAGVRLNTGWGVTVDAPAQDKTAPDGSVPDGAAPTTCMIRPERMQVLPPGPVPPGHNAVPGTVAEVVFMGDVTRYALRTPGGDTVLVRQQNRAGLAVPAVGTAAQAVWAIGDTRLVA